MGAWMLFAMAPGLALCCAALLAEQAARQRRWPSRFIWLAAMAGSILLPALGPAIPQLAPFQLPSAASVAELNALEMSPAPSHVVSTGHPHSVQWPRVLWIALSLATAFTLAACAMLVRHRARNWRRVIIEGREAFIAPESGPAVFGWWRPRIVLPSWLGSAPSLQRELALAHEQSHLDAHDPQLLGVALALLAIMPWNLMLWWQLRRMRHAIEVDCDTRVLLRGHDVLDYGEALLTLGLRRSRHYGLMSASDSSHSLLERRIRIMSSQPNHWSRSTACMLVGLSLCAAAVAAELAPARDVAAATAAPNSSTDLIAPPAPRAAREVRALPAPRAPHAPRTLSSPPALPVPPPFPAPPARPARLPALAVVAPLPPLPPVAAAAPVASVDSEEESADDPVEAATAEAEEAAEHAAELKSDAEEAEKAAQEAMRDAEDQRTQAEDAKREAEAAAKEATARKQDAEAAAARAAQSSDRVN